jgi:hypothetical protein
MSFELLNTFGTFGTFIVIAATALAALIQLRHMRSSNQIAVLSDVFEKNEAAELISAHQFASSELPTKMKDQTFRFQIAHRAARTEENAVLISKAIAVGNFYEEMGMLAKSGLVDCDLLLDMHYQSIMNDWEALSEFTAIMREGQGAGVYENFEYLTVLSQDWEAKHPSGTYPANVRRIDLPNKWRSADLAYAASLAT